MSSIIKRNQTIGNLSGVVTPGMIGSTRIAAKIETIAKLPGEVARAAAAGVGTGGKAVVNGLATSVKSVATLGLSTSQLELIGVTKEDRDRGYDTAVSIATAGGQVLIAVGTGGIATALSKGGSIAQTAGGTLVVFDATGNAVGVVQGIYDAAQNGISVANGSQIAGGLLGLGANAKAMRDGKAAISTKNPIPKPHLASLGQATSSNYRKTFFDAHPGHKEKVIVHHAIEQQVIDRYPGVVSETELHSLENLRGIPKGVNSETHLSEIRKEWNAFYEQHPHATKEELLAKATEIDNKYGHRFDPPIR